MRTITIEGLKGTGKSTIIKSLSSFYHVNLLQKFKNIESTLAVNYYSNFFNNLELATNLNLTAPRIILLNRGLLSLPYFGYYGYSHNSEDLKFREYLKIASELYDLAICKYNTFGLESDFIILECCQETIKKRLEKREVKIVSDTFFLKNIEVYSNMKKYFEEQAIKKIKNTRFFYRNNETIQDLVNIETFAVDLI